MFLKYSSVFFLQRVFCQEKRQLKDNTACAGFTTACSKSIDLITNCVYNEGIVCVFYPFALFAALMGAKQ